MIGPRWVAALGCLPNANPEQLSIKDTSVLHIVLDEPFCHQQHLERFQSSSRSPSAREKAFQERFICCCCFLLLFLWHLTQLPNKVRPNSFINRTPLLASGFLTFRECAGCWLRGGRICYTMPQTFWFLQAAYNHSPCLVSLNLINQKSPGLRFRSPWAHAKGFYKGEKKNTIFQYKPWENNQESADLEYTGIY